MDLGFSHVVLLGTLAYSLSWNQVSAPQRLEYHLQALRDRKVFRKPALRLLMLSKLYPKEVLITMIIGKHEQ
jgi:hypothetical protein